MPQPIEDAGSFRSYLVHAASSDTPTGALARRLAADPALPKRISRTHLADWLDVHDLPSVERKAAYSLWRNFQAARRRHDAGIG